MAGNLLQRARFMAGLLWTVAKRALPGTAPAPRTEKGDEAVIEAIILGDISALNAKGQAFALSTDPDGNPWFFIALEIGSLDAVRWFLKHGANPTRPDRAGRLPLETVIQRAALAEEFDDHLVDCPAMARALLTAGADQNARTVHGQSLADLARAADLLLPQ